MPPFPFGERRKVALTRRLHNLPLWGRGTAARRWKRHCPTLRLGAPHPSVGRAARFSPPARATGGSVTAGALTMRPLLSAHSKQHLCCFDTVRSSFPPRGRQGGAVPFRESAMPWKGLRPLPPHSCLPLLMRSIQRGRCRSRKARRRGIK